MFTAIKIQSNIKPDKFESLNNGIWYYNYDIEELNVLVPSIDNNEEKEEIRYSYVQVRITGEPTLSKCFESILKSYKDENSTTLYDILLTNGANDEINDINYNIKSDFGIVSEKSLLERERELLLRKIDQYDTSSDVNSFFLNGIQVWLDKDTRVGLMNSITIEKNSGKTESTLWLNGLCITVNCDLAIQMLSSLELYALQCYNKTSEHKLNVSKLDLILLIKEYDYKSGYPEKLTFNI